MADRLPKPQHELSDTKELFLSYLDQYRSTIVAKLDGLGEHNLRTSRLPSGWTPIELLKHLVYMERRWFRWGFAAEPVDAPWGDNLAADRDARWHVGPDESFADLVQALHAGGRRTRAIVETADLAELGALGGRFGPGQPRPTLNWILFHVLQEYARHTGHLDIVRELADGTVGE